MNREVNGCFNVYFLCDTNISDLNVNGSESLNVTCPSVVNVILLIEEYEDECTSLSRDVVMCAVGEASQSNAPIEDEPDASFSFIFDVYCQAQANRRAKGEFLTSTKNWEM